VNDQDTTVLSTRLHRLADDLVPQVDVVGQVRAARARHQRQRRGRITLIAVATATAALVVGTTTAVTVLSAPPDGDVAGPSVPTSATTSPSTPTTDPAPPVDEPPATTLPAGWEPRSFQGVTFGVPPGSREADYVMPVPPQGDPATFVWYGPAFPGEMILQTIEIRIDALRGTFFFEGSEPVAVRGAQEAYVSFSPSIDAPEVTGMALDARTADGVLHLDARIPTGPEGEQIGRDLIATIDLTGMDAGPGTLPDGEHFVLVHNLNAHREVMTIEPAEWLGPDRTTSCLPQGADRTIGQVIEYCVGARSPMQTIRSTATQFGVAGPPPRQIGADAFAVFVDTVRWPKQADPQPLPGWVTVESGKVVAFQETQR
jgi:hypothetical protein